MKKLNNAIGIKLLSIITIIVLLQSCSKDPKGGCYTPKDNYYYLTTAQLNQTPYFTNPAFDTISFASDKGDTLTFVKTKTDTTWYTEKGNIGSPDCGYDQNFYQTIHNTYATIKGSGSFDVKHIVKGNVEYLKTLAPNIILINLNNLNFVFAESVIDDITYKNYIGDIIIINKIYPNSFFEFNIPNLKSNIKAYFSKFFGLIELNDSELNINWKLIN